jgi:ABC-2 type transport system ATP-binding protein
MLSIEGLAKKFGKTQALVDVNFKVNRGEIVGFVGRNGSGKTTTMRSIVGLLGVDAGEVRINGRKKSHIDNSIIGYMPEERGLYSKLKVKDQLQYFGELQGLSTSDAKRSTTDLLARFELSDFADRVLSTLSLGNQQRIQFIATLVHEPSLLILDEPFNGLDPVAMAQFIQILRELTLDGTAVLLSSHQLELVSHLCSRIVIIDGGKVLAEDTLTNLQRQNLIKFRLVGSGIPKDLNREFPEIVTYESEDSIIATFHGPSFSREKDRLLKIILENGSLNAFTEIRPSLSEIYSELITHG